MLLVMSIHGLFLCPHSHAFLGILYPVFCVQLRGRPFFRTFFLKRTMFICGWVGVFQPSGCSFGKSEKIRTPQYYGFNVAICILVIVIDSYKCKAVVRQGISIIS